MRYRRPLAVTEAFEPRLREGNGVYLSFVSETLFDIGQDWIPISSPVVLNALAGGLVVTAKLVNTKPETALSLGSSVYSQGNVGRY